jgi:hypothetical protein
VPRFVAKGDFTRQPYIVMERIDGSRCGPRLDAAPLPIDEVIDIGRAWPGAARPAPPAPGAPGRQAQQHHVPADGTAVLVDFGLSRHDHLPDLLDEEFELPMGTGPYMSPEQVQFVRNDPRSDLFALGVMLYHFTTGERPSASPTPCAACASACTSTRCRRAAAARLPALAAGGDPACLEVEPERRYQSAAQLALACSTRPGPADRARRQACSRSGRDHAPSSAGSALGSRAQAAAQRASS